MPYYRDALPYYYGGPFSNHSSLMTGTGRTIHSPLGSSRYAPLLSTISESPLSALRRYSPAATMSSRPKRVIDTADIDVSTPRALSHSDNNHQQNRLRRDRPTIRIRSQALKDNPALREHYERHEKTVGELLVEKFLIKDKKTDGDQEICPKLHTQTSLESTRDKNECEEQLEALQKRVTRRMTRRRSSADVQMDPAQLEREVLIAQAQAVALDTLVAQEQAEIEVETRMGTLIRKNLVRAIPSVLGKHESQTGDENDGIRTEKLAKKVKKRKKTTDKPSPPIESVIDSEFDPRSQKTQEEEANGTRNDTDAETGDNSSANKAMKFKVEASNSVGDFSTLWINASAAEERQMQQKKSQSIVDQFRDSVRLPAPVAKAKTIKKEDTGTEEYHQVIVLPVRKRYVEDKSRNSVYLTLKTQKNGVLPKENDDLVNEVDNVDDRPLPLSNDHAGDARRMTTTLSNGSQMKGQKVAKFRSKDITESDVEVGSICELSGGVEGLGEARRKDAGYDQPSIVSSGSNESETKSISLSENSIETSEPRCEPLQVISDATSHVECNRNHEFVDLCKTSSKKEPSSREVTQVVVPNDTANNNGAYKATKEPKDDVKLVIGGINDKQQGIGKRAKIIKRSVSALDSSSTDAAVQLERTTSGKRDKPVKREEGIASIFSVVSPISIGGSLPNTPTINLLDVTNHTADQVVKYSGIESNSLSHENQKLNTENTEVLDALSDAATEVDDLEYLRKVILKPTFHDELLITGSNKFDKDCEVTGKNVADASKLQDKHKNLEKASNLDCSQSNEVRPESENSEVVSINKKKIVLEIKKPDISTAKEEKSLKSPVKKENLLIDTKKKALHGKIGDKNTKNLTDTKGNIKNLQKCDETPTKLTNGLSKVKLKVIKESEDNRDFAKAEKPKLKIWNKPCTPPIPEDDGIDFWGEIESQRLEKPTPKTDATEIKEHQKICIVEKDAIDSEPELKPNLQAETSTPFAPKVAETVVGKENKQNKIKKKKTTESGECKKKDQEKANAETILKRVISKGGGDENGSQQQQQALSGKTLEKEKNEKKSCESQEVNRFERNLSTIAEENSPVLQRVAGVENLASLISNTQKESTEKTLDSLSNEVSDKLVITASKEPEVITESKTDEPKVSTFALVPEANDAIDVMATGSSKVSHILASVPLELPSLPITESAVPTINIVAAPGTPPNNEEIKLLENQLDEVIQEEEQGGPGTPTNETTDDPPKNISKWNSQADLSLDEPAKDIGPEVLVETKTGTSNKKTSSKKSSSKKSSKGSGGSNSLNSAGTSPDSSKKKKLAKRKKTSGKASNSSEKRTIFEERSESKVSNSSDTTLKPSGLNLRNSPKNSPRNTPKQRPLDLIKMFYTTPASLLTATPRDLSKVRRAKIKKKKHSTRTASANSDSTGSTRSTQSTSTAESNGSTEHEDDVEQKRISSTRSNDSGFDGSPRLSNCDMACHKKCEKLTGNLCGLNQKLVAEALQALKRAPSQSSDNNRNSDGSDHHHASGRITPPATNLPRFKKYTVLDFNFLKVLGKGSFGKVLLAELRRTDCVYAVKCLKKDVVLEDDDVECTLIERKVLTLATRHPYLCHLFCTFQTNSHLFFVMEYLNGGDLMFHIQKSGRFAESRARFYAAEIWSGLNFLHKKGIVYRDLKLDNVLLDFEGHIRIADFGMCKLQIFLDRTADTFCGTPDYMAPEIIKGLKYNQAVDWWSFGVLLYEMLTGQSPFSGCDEDELFWSICNERPFIPRYLSQEAMDVLVCLLEKDAGKRPLAHDIAVHPFFHSTQWDRLERRQLEPPFKPALEHTLDTRYFDTAFTAERPRLTPVPEQILTSMDQGVFRGFSYTNPNATD